MTAGNNMTGTGNMTVRSVSGVDQDEVAEATEVPPGPIVERHPCPGQYVISWHPAICVPWPKGCPCEGPDCPKCPTPALPPVEPPADEQPEEGQPDVQPPADQADKPPTDEQPTGEEPTGEEPGKLLL
jgi:hypothetical protein